MLARPPKPLNSATISGMPVIFTSRDAAMPMPAPITAASTTHSTWMLSMMLSTVAMIAISMPREDRPLPRRAVVALPSILRPNTNMIAETM